MFKYTVHLVRDNAPGFFYSRQNKKGAGITYIRIEVKSIGKPTQRWEKGNDENIAGSVALAHVQSCYFRYQIFDIIYNETMAVFMILMDNITILINEQSA